MDAQAAGGDHVVVWGDSSPTREFLYVEDAAESILLAAERYNESEPVNLGSAFEISVKDLVELIPRITGFAGKIVFDPTKPNGQPRRKLETNRAEEKFGFRSCVSFGEGLRKTVGWYLQNGSQDGASRLGSPSPVRRPAGS